MIRRRCSPRSNWESKVEQCGLTYHHFLPESGKVGPYWDESTYYELSKQDVQCLKRATIDVEKMLREAVDYVITNDGLKDFGFDDSWQSLIRNSFAQNAPDLCTRMNFWYDGKHQPLLYDIDADSTYLFLETALVQLQWINNRFPRDVQWNQLTDRLLAKFRLLRAKVDGALGFVYERDDIASEDALNAIMLLDYAKLAGHDVRLVPLSHLRYDTDAWYDGRNTQLHSIYKLLTWDDLIERAGDDNTLHLAQTLTTIEPAWKRLASNKMMLTVMWQLFPDSEYLLPTFLHANQLRQPFEKPSAVPHRVFQEYRPLPRFEDGFPLMSTWYMNSDAVALSIIESDSPKTDWDYRFVPHVVRD